MSRRPKVALLGGDGGPSGVPRHIRHLATALAEVAEVAVVSDRDRGGYGWATQAGLDHVEVEGLASSLDPRRAARTSRALGAALEGLAPDLVWAHARMSLPLSRGLARRGGWRLMATYHGLPFGRGHGVARSALSLGVETTALRLAPPHHVVFLTEEDRAAFPPWLLWGHEVHLLPNASDLDGFAAREDRSGPTRIVMLTRDSVQKDLGLAARILDAMEDPAELHLHGIGTQAPALRDRLATLVGPGTLARIRFHGPTGEVRPVLAEADLLLVTSRYEGLSIASLEAMEWGLPLATTPVGGAATLAGLHPMMAVIDPAEVAGAARRIDALARSFRADREARSAAIHAAWARAFSPEVFGRNARALLARVMAD